MTNKKKEHKYGILGVAIFYLFLLFILFYSFTLEQDQREFGIELQLEHAQQQGKAAPQKPQTSSSKKTPATAQKTPVPQKQTPPASPTSSSDAQKQLVTQDFEDALALKKKKEQEEKRAKEEAQKKIAQQQELARQQEAERAAAEKRQREEKLAAIKEQANKALANTGETATNATEQASANSSTNAQSSSGDSPLAHLSGEKQGKTGYSLSGRKLTERLPEPEKTFQKEGIVVVEIWVNRAGQVTRATPILTGSTTQNSTLWNSAKEAALKARFNVDQQANTLQKGTITYHFILE